MVVCVDAYLSVDYLPVRSEIARSEEDGGCAKLVPKE